MFWHIIRHERHCPKHFSYDPETCYIVEIQNKISYIETNAELFMQIIVITLDDHEYSSTIVQFVYHTDMSISIILKYVIDILGQKFGVMQNIILIHT